MRYLKGFIRDSKIYFSNCKKDIKNDNIFLLRRNSISALMGLMMYLYVVLKDFTSVELVIAYNFFVVVFGVFCIFCLLYFQKREGSFFMVQALCFVFSVMVLSFFIFISVFPFPDLPAIFLFLGYTFLPLVFIMPMKIYIFLLLAFQGIFCSFVIMFKGSDPFAFDMLQSSIACAAGILIAFMVLDLRLRANKTKLQLQRMNAMDPLTGIFNKATTTQNCRFYLDYYSREEKCSLMVIDIDDFKKVNDFMGHQTGDYILSNIGEILREVSRKSDIVGRIGGDEFLFLMKNTSDREILRYRATQICEKISGLSIDNEKNISCSIGVAVSPEKGTDFKTLFARADKAMYDAKRKGKNTFSIFD
ncbi:MAG: GGDEF domain-containing protein [Clostridiales bacterium]|nr:GGDEF domain-containing protein [Clostridiales bacterium]